MKRIILILLVIVLAIALSIPIGYGSILRSNYTSGEVLSVPFVKQEPALCSEAAASMVLLYYGLKFSQKEINATGFDRFENTLPFLDRYIYCSYESLSAGGLREEVEKGKSCDYQVRIGISALSSSSCWI